jgi:hypothetical protein
LSKITSFFFKKSSTRIGVRIFNQIRNSKYKLLFKLIPLKLRFNRNDPHQIADPFLFEDNENNIWCFFEFKDEYNPGKICVINLQKPKEIINVDIGEKCHLSFPFVFRDDDDFYMLPETCSLKEVALYIPISFPSIWRKTKVLLYGDYVDSHIKKIDKYYYLFTTKKEDGNYLLELFISLNLDGPYEKHPSSPVRTGKKLGRSGGALIKYNGNLLRFSQDCEINYGRELHAFKITSINQYNYIEENFTIDWVQSEFKYLKGGHHASYIEHSFGSKIWAVDFNYQDSYFQRFIKYFTVKYLK